jgi:predicted GIY-YIG superfamily endonuclease
MPFRPELCGRHLVYRHFDSSGNLLYIGMSSSIATRQRDHKHKSLWFSQIAEWTLEEFDTRDAAMAAEKAAIEAERPLHNRTWRNDRQEDMERLTVAIPASWVGKINNWRSEQPDLPNTSEAIRRLAEIGIEASVRAAPPA